MMKLYHRLMAFFKRKRGLSRAQLEKKLGPAGLAAVAAEVAFLRTQAVSVADVTDAEEAPKPRAVDDAVEALLSSRSPQV
jgi:hypothetical protein